MARRSRTWPFSIIAHGVFMESDKPDIMERVRRDLKRGDHWLARQRLESHLSTCGYDPEILAKLGDIALAMHDGFSAGRFYLASSAVGEQVDSAIAVFVNHLARQPNQVASQLPEAVRRATLAQVPEEAAQRLHSAGLDAALEKLRTEGKRRAFQPSCPRPVLIIVVLAFAFAVTCCLAGLWTIGGWMFGG